MQGVRGATDTNLAGLSAEELDRKVTFIGAESPVAEVLVMLAVHSAGHAGEIAALRGARGVEGLPFEQPI